MKIKWGKRTFTFVIIPDANSKVLRLRFSALLLYMIPIAAVSVLCLTLILYFVGMDNITARNEIAAELVDKTEQYEQTLNNKEQTIEELQTNIVILSQQTESMKLKVEELKTLEEELRSISSAETEAANDRPIVIASFTNEETAARGSGDFGTEIDNDDINTLISDTKLTLSALNWDVGSLMDDFSIAKDQIIEQLRLMSITPSVWPTVSNEITSRYGYRRDPFSRKTAFHAGLDISGNSGDPVYASADGVVTYAGYDKAYGNNIIIKHASGVNTHYAHLKKLQVKNGQLVKQRDQIGLLGSTGRSTGPHLHFEIMKKGRTIDPMPYLQAARKGGQ